LLLELLIREEKEGILQIIISEQKQGKRKQGNMAVVPGYEKLNKKKPRVGKKQVNSSTLDGNLRRQS